MFKRFSKFGIIIALIYILLAALAYYQYFTSPPDDIFRAAVLIPFMLPWGLIFNNDIVPVFVILLLNVLMVYIIGHVIGYVWSEIFKKQPQ
jgi:hypothetical protein